MAAPVVLAGYPAKIYASSNGSDWYECDGINSVSLSRSRDNHDVTDFKSTSTTGDYYGAVKRIAGLSSYEVKISGHLEDEATGQGTLRACKRTSAYAWIKVLPDGSTGHYYKGYIKKISFSGQADGLCEVDYTLTCTTAPTAC